MQADMKNNNGKEKYTNTLIMAADTLFAALATASPRADIFKSRPFDLSVLQRTLNNNVLPEEIAKVRQSPYAPGMARPSLAALYDFILESLESSNYEKLFQFQP